MKRSRVLTAIAASLLVLPLAACSASSGMGSAGADSIGPVIRDVAPSAADMPTEMLAEMSAGGMLASDGSFDAAVSAGERSIVHTGSMSLEVASSTDAVEAIADVATTLGGSVVSQSVSRGNGSSVYGQISIRVPSDKLDAAFAQLSELGTVQSEDRSADDVTEQHVDLDARVKSLQAAVDRLTTLMEEATSTSDLLEAESALSARQQELDGLKAQLESLEGQIAQANIWVSVYEASALPGGGPKNFWEAITIGISSIGAFGAGAFLAFGVALPWLVILAAVAAAIVIPLRRRTRRRTRAAMVPDATTQATESVADSQDS